MKPQLCLFFVTVLCLLALPLKAETVEPAIPSSSAAVPSAAPAAVPEFLWTGSWESAHNLTERMELKVTVPQADMALRLEALDRRPAATWRDFTESFAGTTAAKAITQANAGLYHLPSSTRLLYGTLDYAGLPARIRNVWIRGAPYSESNVVSLAEIKSEPSSTALPQIYGCFESPDFVLGAGMLRGLVSYSENVDHADGIPALSFGAEYTLGNSDFRLEGFYTKRILPERKSSTWFNEKPPLPARATQLFAGTASVSLPLFGISADLACSETFAFGRDYYGSLGIRVGDKPWRFSFALDAAGSRYVDSAGNVPGAGYRAAVRLDRRSKKNGLIRLAAQARGTGPVQGFMPALQGGDFAAIAEGTNRITAELYCRLPATSALFGITRFSAAFDHDSRNEKKVLDTAKAMAAFALGPVNSTTEGSMTNQFDSYRVSQGFSWNCPLSAKKPKEKKLEKKNDENTEPSAGAATKDKAPATKKDKRAAPVAETPKPSAKKLTPLTVQVSAKAGYEKAANKEGVWDTSLSASIRGRKNRFSFKAAMASEKWEFTLGWRLSL
jgi:hypothetical protein